jgi:hypothetical protein
VFVVHSDERLAYERAQRIKAMDRVRGKLEKLQRRIATGKLHAADKIGAAAAAILTRNHGHRYFGWSYEDAAFRFFEHPVHFRREQAYEGEYVIQTEEPNLSAVDAVCLYKDLADVERCFANLKDVIDVRPIYHRTKDRVQAHIFVAALAHCCIGPSKTSSKLLHRSLRHQRLNRAQVGARRRHRSRQPNHQTIRHTRVSARRHRAPWAWHHRPRSAGSANPWPDLHVAM